MKYNSIALATHVWADGPSQAFKKYLLKKSDVDLLWISHPLFYDKRLDGSGYEFYQNCKLIEEKRVNIAKIPSIFSYFCAYFSDIYYVLKQKKNYELYIGFNNLNAAAGLFLRWIGKVQKCIYHVTDYTPIRFENKVLNLFYHKIESFCAIRCDETWNLSFRMVDAREKFKGIKRENCGKQKQVPMGTWLQNTKKVAWRDVNKTQIVFMGHLLKKQGVQYVLEAIPNIIKEISSFQFLIIGSGEYERELQRIVKKLNIQNYVKFAGFVKSHDALEKMIAKSAMAVAIYEKGDLLRNWTYYADQGKIKAYLGAGVPVLLTDVPASAKEIESRECGKIITPDAQSLSNTITFYLKNPEKLRQFRKNAFEYIKMYDWKIILDREFLDS